MSGQWRIVLCFAIGITFCGCNTLYREAVAARHDLMYGTGEVASKRAEKMAASTINRKLGCLELSRIKMLHGDFSGSSAVLGPLLDELFDETNEGQVLKKGEIAGNIMAGTFGDDNSIPYELPAFELLFGLQYQAVNQLSLGERDNARVYLRRATAVQEQLKEENETVASSDEENSANAQNAATAAEQIATSIAPVADTVRASYENALAWYLMGAFLMLENDPSNAEIAYREAGRINPDIAPLTAIPAGSGQDVAVVYEENLIDMREPIKIPLPFWGTLWSVDFPIYKAPAYSPSSVAVEAGGVLAATCVPVVNVQALAYRDLKDRIPGIATRNVTRAAVKIAAQIAANQIDTGSNIGNLAIKLGTMAYNATSTILTEADTRVWLTLPEYVQLARLRLQPEQKSIVIRNTQTGRSCEVVIPEGAGRGMLLIWITDVCGFATANVMEIGATGPSVWHRTTSLLNP